MKRTKREKIIPLLACPLCHGPLTQLPQAFRCDACGDEHAVTANSLSFLTRAIASEFDIEATENVSDWEYDPRIAEIIQTRPEGMFLDCGAGLRRNFHANVINFEIVDYSSTDILGVGERLPFRNDALDGVFSVGVLEHVKDPFLCAREITRVLKPGGVLFCAVPFLQPLHAYPHHYYNMTPQGVANLFPALNIEEQFVPLSLHPLKAVQWMVYQYARGLSQPQQKQFTTMTIQNLIKLPLIPKPDPALPFITALHPEKINELASGSCLIARKK